jgi:hypothetical protein
MPMAHMELSPEPVTEATESTRVRRGKMVASWHGLTGPASAPEGYWD